LLIAREDTVYGPKKKTPPQFNHLQLRHLYPDLNIMVVLVLLILKFKTRHFFSNSSTSSIAKKKKTHWVKLVWSLYSQDSAPHAQSRRGSFWWRDVLSLVNNYRSITTCRVGGGETVIFWKDFWHGSDLLCTKFPRLLSYTLKDDDSVSTVAASANIFSHFALPLSAEAFAELDH
jgi:hypothetical protein